MVSTLDFHRIADQSDLVLGLISEPKGLFMITIGFLYCNFRRKDTEDEAQRKSKTRVWCRLRKRG